MYLSGNGTSLTPGLGVSDLNPRPGCGAIGALGIPSTQKEWAERLRSRLEVVEFSIITGITCNEDHH